MTSLKTTLLAVGAVVAASVVGVLGYAATRPDTFHVQRSISIEAPAAKVFPHVNDFHKWTAWSPWEKLDPNLKRTYSGAESGKGAVYAWAGNSDVGKGRMEILEAAAPAKIDIKLNFTEPFEEETSTVFTFAPEGKATTVTWTMDGRNQFIGKLMSVFMDMDKMVGKDFETGLANLKTLAEQ